jgi:uncharacterized membrane protein
MASRQTDRLLGRYLSRRLLLLVVGVVTPLGILVVNASAFVMRNLLQFRFAIAACALISSLVLNGLTAVWLLKLARRRGVPLYVKHSDWAIIAAGIIVVAASSAAAIFTWIGLSDPKRLPDGLSVLTALAALLIPLGLTYASRAFVRNS